MDILQVFIYVGLIFLAVFGILFYWEKKSKLKFFCTLLKWHKDSLWQDSNGFDHFGTCPRCGAKIYQNDDGSWENRKEEIEDTND
jgi:hypothetical protein